MITIAGSSPPLLARLACKACGASRGVADIDQQPAPGRAAMTTVTLSVRFSVADVDVGTAEFAKRAKAMWTKAGASAYQVTQIFTGPHFGQWLFELDFEDLAHFQKCRDEGLQERRHSDHPGRECQSRKQDGKPRTAVGPGDLTAQPAPMKDGWTAHATDRRVRALDRYRGRDPPHAAPIFSSEKWKGSPPASPSFGS